MLESPKRFATPQALSQGLVAAPSTATLGNWIALGPAPTLNAQVAIPPNNPVCGGIQTVAAHPSNPNILYIGAINGGIWRTTNATSASPDWRPLTDMLPSLSIGALEFDATDATRQTLIAGTARLSSFGAEGGARIGVLRSTDGGDTWLRLGGDAFENENLTSVAARGNILLAASDSTWGGGNGSGLFRSSDAGGSFQQISGISGTGLPAGSISDLVGDPGNTSRFFAAVVGVGVFRSDDVGANWIDVTQGITDISDLTPKIEMAVHNSGAGSAVYVAIINDTLVPPYDYELTGLYRSVNSGVSWTLMDVPQTHFGGQGNLHLSIAADPANPSIVYIGGDRIIGSPFTANLFRGDASLAPGSQFETIMDGNAGNTSPHADSREMVFDANGKLIVTDDGGIYRRSNPQSPLGTWTSLIGNLAVIEAHDVAYDSVAGVAMIGTQDNGTHIQSATGSQVWTSIWGGDGGDVAIDDRSVPGQSIRYGSSQFLTNDFFRRTYDAANNLLSTAFPALAVLVGPPIEPQFVTPVKLNNVDPRRLAIGGGNSIYESLDQGETMTAVGSAVNPKAIAYGGSLADLPNPEILYYASGSTVFLRTTNGGTAMPVGSPGGAIVDIVLDSKDWHRAFAIDSSSVYVTPDAGAIWTDITGNLTGVGTLRCLEYIHFPCSYVLAVGTDTGVYCCLDYDLGNWSKLGSGLPNAPAYDLSFNPRAHVLVVGTLGRGVWSFNVPTNAPRISLLDDLFFADTFIGSTSEDVLELCSSCTEDLVVQSITSSNPQFRVVPRSGFPVTISPDHCVSLVVQFVPTTEGDQSTTITVLSNDPLSPIARVQGFANAVRTRVAIFGAEQGFNNADVKAKIVGSGLFGPVQVDVFPAANAAPTPSLAELRQYSAVLVYSNDRFTDATAMGNVLADYLETGGGVVVATHSFSSDGLSGLAGRIVTSGFLPFAPGSPQFSSHLTLVKDLPNHAIMQNVSAFDGGLESTRDAVALTAGATLVAHWSDGTPLVATAETTGTRVVGLNFWSPSSDSDFYGWRSDTDGGRIMANALLWSAAGQLHNPSTPCSGMTVINFDDLLAPSEFVDTRRLTNRYGAKGVTFAGPGLVDGGAILNRNSKFNIAGYSGENFLAFNTTATMSDGSVPRGPESISFAVPVSFVHLLAGTGLDPGGSLTVAAYDAANALLTSSSIFLSSQMTPIQVTADGIRSVVVSTTSRTVVVDDLAFVPMCARPEILPATLRRFSNGQCGFAVSGGLGAQYEIQVSTDLRNWQVLTMLVMTNTMVEFMDINTNVVRRFYRAGLMR